MRWLLIAFIFFSWLPALAQGYPSEPIKLVVPLAAGTAPDVQARFLARFLSNALGVPVVVINRPGAGGAIANRFVEAAAPDGYTLLYSTVGFFVIQPLIDGTTPNLTPISTVFSYDTFIVVRSDTYHAAQDVIDAAHCGQLNFGSIGIGTFPYLQAERFQKSNNIKMQFVPYTSIGSMLGDLQRGDIQVVFVSKPAIMSIEHDTRFSTFKVGDASWSILLGPPGLPQQIKSRLANAVAKLGDAKINLAAIGSYASIISGSDLDRFLANNIEYWRPWVNSYGR